MTARMMPVIPRHSSAALERSKWWTEAVDMRFLLVPAPALLDWAPAGEGPVLVLVQASRSDSQQGVSLR
eukprot:2722621-Rhodomonas_salina.3